MKGSWRRSVAAGALSAALAASGVLVAPPAGAQEVESGTLSFSGDAGDWITGGASYSYSTDGGDGLSVFSSTGSTVAVSLRGYNGDWWNLNLDAPGSEVLAPGTYSSATRYPFNGAGPGLSLSGNGRGCNTLTGSFTITNAVFGPKGYVQTFDATFEQHCEGGTAAARGEVHIANPPPPPELDLQLSVSPKGTVSTVSGDATVDGTVGCNKPAEVTVSGTVVQVVRGVVVKGSYLTTVSCAPGSAVPWTGSVSPDGSTPFVKGAVEVDHKATGSDTDYGDFTSVTGTTIVDLEKLKKPKQVA